MRESSPSVRDRTLRTAELLEGLGHHVQHLDHNPVPSYFVDDFVLYWALLAMPIVRSGQRTSGSESTAAVWTTCRWDSTATRPETCTDCRWPSPG